MDFLALAAHCAPSVHPLTMAAVAKVESGFNPYAIGVVSGRLERQPRGRDEAVATAKSLAQQGFNFSLGAVQVNRHNLARYGLDYESAFDACSNLRAGAAILGDCFARATKTVATEQGALRAAFSCYYSGNFTTGFREGYVAKVVGGSEVTGTGVSRAIPVIRDPVSRSLRRAPGVHAASRLAEVPISSPVPSVSQSALLF